MMGEFHVPIQIISHKKMGGDVKSVQLYFTRYGFMHCRQDTDNNPVTLFSNVK